MSLCFVFSGTSEGRELTEQLADSGISCLVFVATEYGNSVMKPHSMISVNVGRLNADEITERINNYRPDFIIDATHPHAEIITENIKKACEASGASDRYIMVDRNVSDGVLDTGYDAFKDIVYEVSSVDEAVTLLRKSESEYKKILLTTGVKELHNFITDGLTDRLVVRVIPSIESLNEVYRCGISTKSVIAMEGPFSVEMNMALIKQYGIGILVTKNSGKRGGYLEKLTACSNCGIKAIVIEKKEADKSGKSVNEALKYIEEKLDCKNILSEKQKKKIYLIGTGICKEEFLSVKARDIIKSCDVIIGAKRMTEFGCSLNKKAKVFSEYNPGKILEIIDGLYEKNYEENNKEIRRKYNNNITVLYSGDTGLCSGTKGFLEIIKDRKDICYEIIPGTSSVSYFASKIGIQYSDYPFVSLHNNKEDYMNILKNNGGFIAICSGVKDVIEVSKNVLKFSPDFEIMCGFNLGSADEKIFEINSSGDVSELSEGLYVLVVKKR